MTHTTHAAGPNRPALRRLPRRGRGATLWSACAFGLTAAVLTAAACGSTVRGDHALRGGGADEGDLGVSTSGATDAAAADGRGAGTGPATGAASTAVGRADGSAPSSRTTPPPSPTDRGTEGRGVTDTEILIGIPWLDTGSAEVAALTGSDDLPNIAGEGQRNAQAVVDHINQRGGIAGRKLKPVYVRVGAAEQGTPAGRSQMAQRLCAAWTEDARVFAFMYYSSSGTDTLVNCAANTRTPYVNAGEAQFVDDEWAARITPYMYVLNGLTAERHERLMATRLAARGFFEPGARVGLLVNGEHSASRKGVERALKPALKEMGITAVAEVVYPDSLNSPWSTYVLDFRRADVTHVIFAAGSSIWAPLRFMLAAEDQLYRPRYGGIGSANSPAGLAALAPAEQLRNVTAVGWQPWAADLTADPGPVSPRDEECRAVMRNASVSWTPHTARYCEALFFIRDSLNVAPELTPRGMARAAASFGTSWQSVFMWTTRFSAGRYDAVDTVQDLAYESACDCFKYVGERMKAP